VASTIVQGIVAGLIAGIPQVLVTQIEARLLALHPSHADVGPRFVDRLARQMDASLPRPLRWLVAGAFHFGYAAWWGGVYAFVHEREPVQPEVGGSLLASVIYLLAFSPWGAATQAGAEAPTEERPARETLLHWSAALTFSLVTAYLYQAFRKNQNLVGRE
jgi:hypothetical protein